MYLLHIIQINHGFYFFRCNYIFHKPIVASLKTSRNHKNHHLQGAIPSHSDTTTTSSNNLCESQLNSTSIGLTLVAILWSYSLLKSPFVILNPSPVPCPPWLTWSSTLLSRTSTTRRWPRSWRGSARAAPQRPRPRRGGTAPRGRRRRGRWNARRRRGHSSWDWKLADAILARADEDSIDKELEEMDRQLKLQVEEFRRQQRRDSEETEKVQHLVPEIAPELASSASSSFKAEESPAPEELQELQRLRDLAAQMDEAFPEATELEGDASDAPSAPAASAVLRLGGYQELPMDGPLDEEVSHFKTVLDQLDLRLRALQSKQDLHMEDTDAGNSRGPPPMVAELQVQNQVLRDLLSGDQRKGRLNFDRKLFGAASTA
ncbi:unnamed protein product [Cladocopium goreaui]|uniref:E3 ubiquitin-protein ligase HERC1 n=1 Tax=Cladocopium goreaui TaxID=2562237 RepID=A0A9P1G0N2_9DINO|nr:unnamed protein product [Cladocopium goreaui]